MNKLKVTVGAVSSILGIAGISISPMLYKSLTKIDSGGKSVAGSWPKGTTLSSEYSKIGTAFAPFLIDLKKTDDVFWKQRLQEKKDLIYKEGEPKFFSDLKKNSTEEEQVAFVRKVCSDLSEASRGSYNKDELDARWQLCSMDGTSIPSGIQNIVSTKLDQNKLKVSEVCEFMVNTSETICVKN